MTQTDDLLPSGERIRKAVRWISDMTLEHPGKNRAEIIKEAGIKFDLTPKECHFLHTKFCVPGSLS